MPHMCIDAGLDYETQKKAAEDAVSVREGNAPNPVAKLDLIRGGIEPPMAGVLLTGKNWHPGQVITIGFLDGSTTLQQRVKEAAEVWTKYANLSFRFFINPNDADIRITFNRGGSWSYLGTDNLQIKDAPTMQFGWLEANSPSQMFEGVVPHEFGHMLGLGHEQKSPSANIPWDEDAVYRYYGGPPNNWTKQQIDHNVLGRYKETETNFSRYDPESIMQYAVDNSLTIGDFEILPNRGLSAMDKKFIGETYPYEDEPEKPDPRDKMRRWSHKQLVRVARNVAQREIRRLDHDLERG